MKNHVRVSLVTRDDVLKLLSPREAAGVSMVDMNARLSAGDEYLDLENLTRGVRTAKGASVRMATVLPRKSLEPATWLRIVDLLSGMQGAAAVE